jgi:hypothetical protein
MGQLNFPNYAFKIKVINEKKYIFDRLRKKYVALQPEELVRQHMVEYLIEEKKLQSITHCKRNCTHFIITVCKSVAIQSSLRN